MCVCVCACACVRACVWSMATDEGCCVVVLLRACFIWELSVGDTFVESLTDTVGTHTHTHCCIAIVITSRTIRWSTIAT